MAISNRVRKTIHPEITADPALNKRVFDGGEFGWVPSIFAQVSEIVEVTDTKFLPTSCGDMGLKMRPFLTGSSGIIKGCSDSKMMVVHFIFSFEGEFHKKVPENEWSNWIEIRNADEWRKENPGKPDPLHILLVEDREVRKGSYLHKVPSTVLLSFPLASARGKMVPHSKCVLVNVLREWSSAYLKAVVARFKVDDKAVGHVASLMEAEKKTNTNKEVQR